MTKYEAAGHTAFTAERQQEMNPGAVLAFSLSKKKIPSFVPMAVLSAPVSVYHVWAWCTQKRENGFRSPGTGVTYHMDAGN